MGIRLDKCFVSICEDVNVDASTSDLNHSTGEHDLGYDSLSTALPASFLRRKDLGLL